MANYLVDSVAPVMTTYDINNLIGFELIESEETAFYRVTPEGNKPLDIAALILPKDSPPYTTWVSSRVTLPFQGWLGIDVRLPFTTASVDVSLEYANNIVASNNTEDDGYTELSKHTITGNDWVRIYSPVYWVNSSLKFWVLRLATNTAVTLDYRLASMSITPMVWQPALEDRARIVNAIKLDGEVQLLDRLIEIPQELVGSRNLLEDSIECKFSPNSAATNPPFNLMSNESIPYYRADPTVGDYSHVSGFYWFEGGASQGGRVSSSFQTPFNGYASIDVRLPFATTPNIVRFSWRDAETPYERGEVVETIEGNDWVRIHLPLSIERANLYPENSRLFSLSGTVDGIAVNTEVIDYRLLKISTAADHWTPAPEDLGYDIPSDIRGMSTPTYSLSGHIVTPYYGEFPSTVLGQMRNFYNPSLLVRLATNNFTDDGNVSSNNSVWSFYVPVNEGEVYSIWRESNTNNRFDYGFTTVEPAVGVPFMDGVGGRDRSSLKIENIVVPTGAKYMFFYLSNANETIPNITLVQQPVATEEVQAYPIDEWGINYPNWVVSFKHPFINHKKGIISTKLTEGVEF